MIFNKVTITGELAHFKSSNGGKNQLTHDIPPISTIIGILKNIYGEKIKEFKFGYTFESYGKCKQMEHIHKELNLSFKSKADKDRFSMYPSIIEYHTSPKLVIYHTIDLEPIIESPLNLGRQSCMATAKFETVEVISSTTTQTGIITSVGDGMGIISRQNIETSFDKHKGYFDYYTMPLRTNLNEVDVCCEDEDGNGIYLWRYIEKGNIECYKEKL